MPQDYAPGTAVREYQDILAETASRKPVAALPPVESYDLRAETPNWNDILNIGCGKHGLKMYSDKHLLDAKSWLLKPIGHKPHGGAYFTISEQLERVGEELERRHQPLSAQVAREFSLFNL